MNNSSDSSGEFSYSTPRVLPCSTCHRALILPDGVSDAATIQCPNCDQEYCVRDLLHDDLLQWKVVYDPASGAGDASAEVEQQSEVEVVAGNAEEIEPAKIVSADSDEAGEETSSLPNMEWTKQISQRRSPKKAAPRSIWSSVLQIVLGGVAAVPISLLILWHVFHRDVLDAAPTVGRYVPWIVPERFRPYPEYEQNDASEKRDQRSRPKRGGFRQFDLGPVGRSGTTGKNVQAARVNAAAAPLPSPEELSPASERNRTTTTDAARNRSQPSSPSPQPTGGTGAPEPASAKTGVKSSGDAIADPFSLVNRTRQELLEFADFVNGAVTESQTDAQSVSTDSDAETRRATRQRLAQQAYGTLVELAKASDALPGTSPRRRILDDKLDDLVRLISEQPAMQRVIEQGGAYWVGQQREPGRFAALLFTAESMDSQRPDQIQISPDDPMVDLGIAHVQAADYRQLNGLQLPQRLFALGKLVEPDSPSEAEASTSDETPPELLFRASYLRSLSP